MLPKKRRIRTELFDEIHAGGYTVSGEHMYMKVLQKPSFPTQFAVVAPKSSPFGAITRRLLKRRAYNVLSSHIEDMRDGYAVIFFFKKDAPLLNFADIESEILNLLKKKEVYVPK